MRAVRYTATCLLNVNFMRWHDVRREVAGSRGFWDAATVEWSRS